MSYSFLSSINPSATHPIKRTTAHPMKNATAIALFERRGGLVEPGGFETLNQLVAI